MAGNILPRYDKDSDESRHGAVSKEHCTKMGTKYGWRLKRVEEIGSSAAILKVDCVFDGDTEFPKSFNEGDDSDD